MMKAKLFACVVLALVAGQASGAIIIESWSFETSAGDFVDGPGEVVVYDSTVSLPFNFIRTVEAGASRSTSVYDFTVSGSNAIFEFNFDHLRDGDGPTGGKNYGDYAKSYGYIDFTTFIPLSYMIEGCYSMHGSNGLYISAALGSNGSMLFRNMQYSPYTTNESFTLGNAEGSGSNSLYGTLTGTLLPGKHYLSYDYFLPTMSTDPGATAVGTLRLTLTPEPATLTLLGIGLTLLPRRRGLHSLELSSR